VLASFLSRPLASLTSFSLFLASFVSFLSFLPPFLSSFPLGSGDLSLVIFSIDPLPSFLGSSFPFAFFASSVLGD
jgi:hypothetical protein